MPDHLNHKLFKKLRKKLLKALRSVSPVITDNCFSSWISLLWVNHLEYLNDNILYYIVKEGILYCFLNWNSENLINIVFDNYGITFVQQKYFFFCYRSNSTFEREGQLKICLFVWMTIGNLFLIILLGTNDWN